MARASRIKDLQELLGFSLAEVRVVLDTEDVDVLDRVRSEYRRGDTTPARRRQLLDDAIEANDRLLDRLDDTLRPGSVPSGTERAVKADRLREARERAGQGVRERGPARAGRHRHAAHGRATEARRPETTTREELTDERGDAGRDGPVRRPRR